MDFVFLIYKYLFFVFPIFFLLTCFLFFRKTRTSFAAVLFFNGVLAGKKQNNQQNTGFIWFSYVFFLRTSEQ